MTREVFDLPPNSTWDTRFSQEVYFVTPRSTAMASPISGLSRFGSGLISQIDDVEAAVCNCARSLHRLAGRRSHAYGVISKITP